jgi:hypothetical protein
LFDCKESDLPFVMVDDWNEATKIVVQIYDNRELLELKRVQVYRFWNELKVKLKSKFIKEFL